MKKRILIALILILMLTMCSCANSKATVADAISEIGMTTEEPYDQSQTYDLDERISHFQLFSANGQGWFHYKGEEGLLSVIFNTSENDDGTVTCTVKEIYLENVGNIGMGWLSDLDKIKEYIGEDLEFTLYLDEDNVVTSDDLPTLLAAYTVTP